MGPARAFLILTIFFSTSLVILPVQLVLTRFHGGAARAVPFHFYRFLHRLLGVKPIVSGCEIAARPTLFVTNHVSWLDIIILGGVTPSCFVAKSEVGNWPFFGAMARASRTVFLERGRRSQTANQRSELHRRLDNGDSLFLFPEGTSSDGNRVLPFKSALFSVADMRVAADNDGPDQAVTVQPVSITYTKLNGMPMGRQFRPFFAWYGDMDLFPHLWAALSLGRVEADVRFHEPVNIDEAGGRKALAKRCQTEVTRSVASSLNGTPAAVSV